jgi:hypothetical protein
VAVLGKNRFLSIGSPNTKPHLQFIVPVAVVSSVTFVSPDQNLILEKLLFGNDTILLPVDSSMMPLPARIIGATVLPNKGMILVPVCETVRTLFQSIIGLVEPVRDHENPVRAYWLENDSSVKYVCEFGLI